MRVALALPTGPAVTSIGSMPARCGTVDEPEVRAEVAQADRMTSLLLRVAATTDRSAFAELYAHYGLRVRAYMRKTGADGSAAEDLAQEVMAAVWNKARLFDPAKANANTWIFTIARNLRIDLIRRERRPEIDAEELALQAAGAESPERSLLTRRDAAAVRAALAELPEDQ